MAEKYTVTNTLEAPVLSKNEAVHLERTLSEQSEAINDARIAAFTEKEQRRIIRKIDFRLVPTLGFMYCVSLMDRTNLGIAVVGGMGYDLALVGARYSIIVLLFFITYVALQPPATVILRKVGPKVFLPTITVLWGIVMVGFGFVKEWTTLLPLRLLLGIFEAGEFIIAPLQQTIRLHYSPRVLPGMRLPPFYMVPALRTTEAERCVLLDRVHVVSILWYTGVRSNEDEWSR